MIPIQRLGLEDAIKDFDVKINSLICYPVYCFNVIKRIKEHISMKNLPCILEQLYCQRVVERKEVE